MDPFKGPLLIYQTIVNIFRNSWIIALLMFCIGVLTFSNALHNPFLMDDHTFFFSDMKMPNQAMMWEYFVPDMRKHLGMDKVEVGASYYRPLAHILPSLCYQIFGDDTFKHHLFNLLLFLVLCFIICRAVLLVTKDDMVAVLTALLFCVHPINGLMVNYITAQVFTLQLILMLACAMLYIKSAGRLGSWQYIVSILCFMLSLLCHETAMAMPFYVLLLWAFVLRIKKIGWFTILPFFFVLSAYALFRWYFASLKVSILDKFFHFNIGTMEYLSSLMHAIGWYLSKLVFLKGIVLIWVTEPVRTGVLWHMLGLGGVIILLVMALRYCYLRHQHLFAAMLWFIIGFIPVAFACLFKPKHGIMFEPHWMFFASLGFFFALACLLKKVPRPYSILLAVLLIVALMVVSRAYNALWSNERRYCEFWLHEVPGHPWAMIVLAAQYVREGRYDDAKVLYAQCGDDWGIQNNLGLLALRQGKTAEAKAYFLKALEKNPNAGLVYTNLAGIEFDAGQIEQAKEYLLRSITLNRYLIATRRLLMKVYVVQQKFSEAFALSQETLAIFPDDDHTLFFRILLYLQTGHTIDAREVAVDLARQAKDPKVLQDLYALAKQYHFNDVVLAITLRQRKL